MERCGMIAAKADNHGTIVTVLNWETYQGKDETSGQPTDNGRTTSGQPADT
jgi:hypothetical protein